MSASGERREHSSHARLVGIFLFTDIEGSTRLWEADAERMQGALAEHDAIIKAAVAANHGEVFKTIGDAFCCFFADGGDAISAAVEIQLGLASRNWSPLPDLRTRVSIYSGAAATRENDFFGPALNRAARVLAAAHGGQILVSQSVMDGVVALPRGITLRDLGQHRLRDVQQPEYLYQVLHAELQPEFPPLRTLTTSPDHLPKPVSSFVGREREVGQIASMLRQTRLLTLTGAGGTGKTRLALEVARRRRADYGDGAWFVDLSPLLDGGLIAQAAATALGVAWEAGRDISDTLKSFLQSRVVLLILDNCEHLVDAVARFVSETLSGSAGLTILATSRQALGLPGETTFRVPSMELPAKENRSLTKLRDSDPIRLFVDRAALVQEGFALTQENSETLSRICEELEGIPLAIELAAARVRSMPLDRIAERLDQRFRLLSQSVRGVIPRHQTLRAMIDWSYDLLSEPERLLLQRISVFSVGFTLDAAEAVCSDRQLDAFDVLELAAALVEKSLLMYYEPTGRYRLQETVRAYAKELLSESGDEARVRGRHLTYLAQFAERGEPNLLGASAKSWLEALDAERENFRTAIEWSIQAGDPAVGMRLAVALARFFQGRGYIVEGRAVFNRLLARSDSLDELSRAKGLRAASVLARSQGDSESAVELGRQSLHLFETAGDLDGAAAAMQALGLASWNLGRIAESQEYTIRSLELRRRQGNLPLVALCLNNLGGATFHQGNYPAALAYYSEALEINRRLENRPSIAYNLGNIAELALAQGDPKEALALGSESFSMLVELGDRPALVQLLGTLAIALDRLGRGESAARLFGAQTELGEQFEVAIPEIERDAAARAIGECRARIGESSFEKAFSEGRKLRLSEIEEVLNGRP